MATLARSLVLAALCALFAILAPAGAAAQTQFVDEVKVGVLAHDVGFLGDHIEKGADVNLEVLFPSPYWLGVIGAPRPMIGGDINTAGATSDGYFGLTWGARLMDLLGIAPGVFVDGGLGGAVHNGFQNEPDHPADRKLLGSRILFHLSADVGYQLTPGVSVEAFIDHMSNANLAPHNAGITNAGMRLGFRF